MADGLDETWDGMSWRGLRGLTSQWTGKDAEGPRDQALARARPTGCGARVGVAVNVIAGVPSAGRGEAGAMLCRDSTDIGVDLDRVARRASG